MVEEGEEVKDSPCMFFRKNVHTTLKINQEGSMPMDYNNNNTSLTRELPLGFGFALARNERAMQRYAQLSESEKEQIINRCRDAKSKAEMQKIVDEMVPQGNVSSLFEGPKTN